MSAHQATNSSSHRRLSLTMAFAMGSAILIVGPVAAWIVMMICAQWLGPASTAFRVLSPLLISSPLLLVGALATGFAVRGNRHAAFGAGLALASAVAILLVILAAYFGAAAFTGK